MNQYPGWNGGECVQQTCSTCMYYDPSYGEKESSRFFWNKKRFFFSVARRKKTFLAHFIFSLLSLDLPRSTSNSFFFNRLLRLRPAVRLVGQKLAKKEGQRVTRGALRGVSRPLKEMRKNLVFCSLSKETLFVSPPGRASSLFLFLTDIRDIASSHMS